MVQPDEPVALVQESFDGVQQDPQPGGRPRQIVMLDQMREQSLAGSVADVEYTLEAVLTTEVGIGDLAITRDELAEQLRGVLRGFRDGDPGNEA